MPDKKQDSPAHADAAQELAQAEQDDQEFVESITLPEDREQDEAPSDATPPVTPETKQPATGK